MVRLGVVGLLVVGWPQVDRRTEVFLGCCSVHCPRLHSYASSTRCLHFLLFLASLLFSLLYLAHLPFSLWMWVKVGSIWIQNKYCIWINLFIGWVPLLNSAGFSFPRLFGFLAQMSIFFTVFIFGFLAFWLKRAFSLLYLECPPPIFSLDVG